MSIVIYNIPSHWCYPPFTPAPELRHVPMYEVNSLSFSLSLSLVHQISLRPDNINDFDNTIVLNWSVTNIRLAYYGISTVRYVKECFLQRPRIAVAYSLLCTCVCVSTKRR